MAEKECVQQDMKVGVSYQLKVNGELKDEALSSHPLEFIMGHGHLLPAFERELEGLTAGSSFSFTLPPEEGYGVYDDKRCFWLDKKVFAVEGEFPSDVVVEGAYLPMLLAGGMRVQGLVKEVSPTQVYMDFNHPLAGQTLAFSGKVEHVTKASEEELAALQRASSCGGGGCHCGDHSGGCGCDNEGSDCGCGSCC